MRGFETYIGVDWSGASRDDARVDLAIAIASNDDAPQVVAPPASRARRWTRDEAMAWLVERLRPDAPRAVVGIDAALGYPHGAERAMFGVEVWARLVRELGALYPGSAATFARRLNDRFEPGAEPFRFDHNRRDWTFHTTHDIAYYRQCDLIVPQAISPFYLGSGAKVGYHTITCLAQVARLIELREDGEVDFRVWPQETGPRAVDIRGDFHVLAEAYPSILPDAGSVEHTPHERDALRIARFLRGADDEVFDVPQLSVGRATDVSWSEQLAVEGWIVGVV